jgi:hypothetical protein
MSGGEDVGAKYGKGTGLLKLRGPMPEGGDVAMEVAGGGDIVSGMGFGTDAAMLEDDR